MESKTNADPISNSKKQSQHSLIHDAIFEWPAWARFLFFLPPIIILTYISFTSLYSICKDYDTDESKDITMFIKSNVFVFTFLGAAFLISLLASPYCCTHFNQKHAKITQNNVKDFRNQN